MTEQQLLQSRRDYLKRRRRQIAVGVLIVVIIILLATLLGDGHPKTPRAHHATTTTAPTTPTTTPPVTTTTQKAPPKVKIPTKSAGRALVNGTKLSGFYYNVSTVGYGYLAPPGTLTFGQPTGTPERGIVVLCVTKVSPTGRGYCHPKYPLTYPPGTYRYEVEFRSAKGSPFEGSNTFETFKIAAKSKTVPTTTTTLKVPPPPPTTTTTKVPTVTTTTTPTVTTTTSTEPPTTTTSTTLPPTSTTTTTVLPTTTTTTTTTTVPPTTTTTAPVGPQLEVPSAPQALAAQMSGDANSPTVGVAWSPPSSNGGSPVTLYTATDSEGNTCTTTSTSCTIANVADGVPTLVSVSATNAVGTGPAASTSTVLFEVPISTAQTSGDQIQLFYSMEAWDIAPGTPLPTGTWTITNFTTGALLCTVTSPGDFAQSVLYPYIYTANCNFDSSLISLGQQYEISYPGDTVFAAPPPDIYNYGVPTSLYANPSDPGYFQLNTADYDSFVTGAVRFIDVGTNTTLCTENITVSSNYCPLDMSSLPSPIPPADSEVEAVYYPPSELDSVGETPASPTIPAPAWLSSSTTITLGCGYVEAESPACPGPVSLANSTVSVDQTTVPADGSSYATITVTLEDASGDPISGSQINDPATVYFPDDTTGVFTNAQGVATLEAHSSTPEQVTFRLFDQDPAGPLIGTITVTFTPDQLAFTSGPTLISGPGLQPSFQVSIENSDGSVVSSSSDTITISSSCVLGGQLSAQANEGVATFSDVEIDSSGGGSGCTLTAIDTSDTSVTAVTSSSISV